MGNAASLDALKAAGSSQKDIDKYLNEYMKNTEKVRRLTSKMKI